MEVFVELTRRCNLACTHCLRGNAQAKDMSEGTLWNTLRKLDFDYLGVGGGESLITDKYIRRLRNAILQTNAYQHLNNVYMVTNGKGLVKPRGKEIADVIRDFPVASFSLHVSTDQWHDMDAEYNHNVIDDMFEGSGKVHVHKHGPDGEYNILDMGRSGRGKPIQIYSDHNMLYVDIYGYVWASCDLSYIFMRKFTDRALCFGNVNTDSAEDILQNYKNLSEYLDDGEEGNWLEVREEDGGVLRSTVTNYINQLKEAI